MPILGRGTESWGEVREHETDFVLDGQVSERFQDVVVVLDDHLIESHLTTQVHFRLFGVMEEIELHIY